MANNLIDRCFSVIQKFSRLPNIKDEQFINQALDMFGTQGNGKPFFPLVKSATFGSSTDESFPTWMIDYMENVMAMFPEADNRMVVSVTNGYKGEFYRSCAVNFLAENKTVYRLTDECAEYINDINVSKVRIKDINFPQKKFTINFRMDGRDFIIMVIRDENGMRMSGINTTVKIDNEPSFASHCVTLNDEFDLRRLCRIEAEQWKIHENMTGFKYDLSGSRGFEIIQMKMRAFVLKFMFLYSTRMMEKKTEIETIRKVKMTNYPEKIITGSHHVHYVSLTQKQSQHMREHREIMSAITKGERNWYTDMWPVGAYVRTINGKVQHIESHWAHRRVGMVTERPQQIVVTV